LFFEALDKLTQESSLEVRGRVRRDARAPGGYEVDFTGFKIYQIADSYPITPMISNVLQFEIFF
jgi:asparaginyl-tRNA synthetase